MPGDASHHKPRVPAVHEHGRVLVALAALGDERHAHQVELIVHALPALIVAGGVRFVGLDEPRREVAPRVALGELGVVPAIVRARRRERADPRLADVQIPDGVHDVHSEILQGKCQQQTLV